eukprot:568918-Rhodomonas_salina.1
MNGTLNSTGYDVLTPTRTPSGTQVSASPHAPMPTLLCPYANSAIPLPYDVHTESHRRAHRVAHRSLRPHMPLCQLRYPPTPTLLCPYANSAIPLPTPLSHCTNSATLLPYDVHAEWQADLRFPLCRYANSAMPRCQLRYAAMPTPLCRYANSAMPLCQKRQ